MSRKNGPRSMTVAELRSSLEEFDDDAVVLFASNYGDHSNTQQVSGIEELKETPIVESAYSESGWALPYDDEDDDEDDDSEPNECPVADPDCSLPAEEDHRACKAPKMFVVLT